MFYRSVNVVKYSTVGEYISLSLATLVNSEVTSGLIGRNMNPSNEL